MFWLMYFVVFLSPQANDSSTLNRTTNASFNIISNVLFINQIERRGEMVNTPASYLGGPGFKFRSEDQIF
jgi:hypothetical protein